MEKAIACRLGVGRVGADEPSQDRVLDAATEIRPMTEEDAEAEIEVVRVGADRKEAKEADAVLK